MLSGDSRTIDRPAGSAATTFISAAMMVAGIGLAVEGLLLAAAGLLLGIIDWNRFNAANPWVFPKDDPEAMAAAFSGKVAKISLSNGAVVLLLGLLALAVVQRTDEPLYALAPAALAGLISIWQEEQMMAALQRRGR